MCLGRRHTVIADALAGVACAMLAALRLHDAVTAILKTSHKRYTAACDDKQPRRSVVLAVSAIQVATASSAGPDHAWKQLRNSN